MKIGDRVFVRGYIDEIRKDTVIIRNAGGYFGTIPSEVITGELPSAQPETNCSEIPNNSDLISRQDAIDALDEQIELCNKALGSFDISTKDEYAIKVERASLKAYREQLKNLTSAQPERKKGEWSDGYRWQRCSLCKQTGKKSWNYCPNCGADMRGEQYG